MFGFDVAACKMTFENRLLKVSFLDSGLVRLLSSKLKSACEESEFSAIVFKQLAHIIGVT